MQATEQRPESGAAAEAVRLDQAWQPGAWEERDDGDPGSEQAAERRRDVEPEPGRPLAQEEKLQACVTGQRVSFRLEAEGDQTLPDLRDGQHVLRSRRPFGKVEALGKVYEVLRRSPTENDGVADLIEVEMPRGSFVTICRVNPVRGAHAIEEGHVAEQRHEVRQVPVGADGWIVILRDRQDLCQRLDPKCVSTGGHPRHVKREAEDVPPQVAASQREMSRRFQRAGGCTPFVDHAQPVHHLRDLGLTLESFRDHLRDSWSQHVVGVEEDHDVSTHPLQARVEGGRLAEMGLYDRDHLRIALDHGQRFIHRAVVDHDDLAIGVGLREAASDRVVEEACVVAVGDENADPQ